MTAGDIVLAALPQADEAVKLRPALLLCQPPPFDDWLACGISTQIGGTLGTVTPVRLNQLRSRLARHLRAGG